MRFPRKKTIPADLGDRLVFQAQNLFRPQIDESCRPKAFCLKGVLHDCSDADCLNILRSVVTYVGTGLKVVICERILPSEGDERTQLDRMKDFMDTLMCAFFDTGEPSREDSENVINTLDA
jgi:hypothetical protein